MSDLKGIPVVSTVTRSGEKYVTRTGGTAIKDGIKQRSDTAAPPGGRKPSWLRAPMPGGERFEELLGHAKVRIERIVSSSEPETTLYDQSQDEWVLLIEGRAQIELAGEALDLSPGDWLFIPAHTPHRILSTSPQPRCLWLAVHLL